MMCAYLPSLFKPDITLVVRGGSNGHYSRRHPLCFGSPYSKQPNGSAGYCFKSPRLTRGAQAPSGLIPS